VTGLYLDSKGDLSVKSTRVGVYKVSKSKTLKSDNNVLLGTLRY
jgi:hypothetical protein